MFSSNEKNKKIVLAILLLVGVCIWSITMVKSGQLYNYGLGFWGANGHDGIWHIAIINSLSRGSLQMPIFPGEEIKNYHLGFDALVALLSRLTAVSPINIYFQVLPPIFALLIGLLTYVVVKNWRKSETAGWWAVFFVYFGTSFGWLLGKGDSVFWAQQSLSTLINPPFALSLILMLAGIWAIQTKRYVVAMLCFGLLTEVKVYAGLLCLAGLGIAALKNRELLKVWIGSFIISVPLFLLTNSGASSLISLQPGWFLESLFAPDRLNQTKLFSALNTYRVGQIWYKAVPAFSFAFLIFFIGNCGLRIAGIFSIKISDWFERMSVVIIVLGAIIPMLFVQKGTPWNTIQFFYYSLFFLSLFAAVSIDKLINSSKSVRIKYTVVLAIICFSIPEIYTTLGHYLPNRPPAKVSVQELSALKFLSQQPVGTVVVPVFDKHAADAAINQPPRPLYLYESTAYVSALSGQPTYMADEVNLNITNFDVATRRAQVESFFQDPSDRFLQEHNIKYVYLTPNITVSMPDNSKLLYNQDGFKIYETIQLSEHQ